MLQRFKSIFQSNAWAENSRGKPMKVQAFFMKIMGFGGQSNTHRFFQWFFIACNGLSGFFELLCVLVHRDDLVLAADAFGTFITAVIEGIKAFVFVFKSEELQVFKEKIEKLNDEGLWIGMSKVII
jgi:hypothetical protein